MFRENASYMKTERQNDKIENDTNKNARKQHRVHIKC